MDNITIVENFELPSKGKIYSDRQINPKFQLRSMTTEDEMKRLSHSEDGYALMSEMIDSCITNEIGMSSYDMHLGDYQYILHRLRVVTYGAKYKMSSMCPMCGNRDEYEISLDSLEVLDLDQEKFDKYRTVTLPKSNKVVEIKFITPRMLDMIDTKKREATRKGIKTDNSLLYTLCAIVKSIDGKVYDPVKLEQIMRKLPLADTNTILKYSDKLNSLVGLNTIVPNICSKCGVDYNIPFRISSEFFGPSVD